MLIMIVMRRSCYLRIMGRIVPAQQRCCREELVGVIQAAAALMYPYLKLLLTAYSTANFDFQPPAWRFIQLNNLDMADKRMRV